MSFLFTHGNDARRESRRITLGLLGLAAVSVVLLNFGVYQTEQNRVARENWGQLARVTDAKRDQMQSLFQSFARQSRYVADQIGLASSIGSGSPAVTSPMDRQRLEDRLAGARQVFRLQHIALVAPDGRVIATSPPGTVVDEHQHDLARRAAQKGDQVVADVTITAKGRRALEIAAPIDAAAPRGTTPILLSAMSADESLHPLLAKAEAFGPSRHAYLVRQEGGRIVYLTSPVAVGSTPPAPAEADRPEARAAAMAAAGVESNLVVEDGGGRLVWATTRFLPELGWGLVMQVDRDDMMIGTRHVLGRLLAIDAAILGLGAFLAWLWKRQYRRGIARHEELVTHRHAARVQAIFDTAFDAIITFDRLGRVRTVNRAAEQLFGRRAAEMDGQPLQRFLHWGSARGDNDLPVPGVVCVAEALRADGTVCPAEFSLGEAGEGEELLYTAIVRDIRERVEAEGRIRTYSEGLEAGNRRLEEVNAQLEEASRLKSEFLANTSHELRTPLNGMIGFLQLVLDGMCENEEEERDFLKQALQCSRHLLGLINDVLDIAKIESGKLSLEIEKVDIDTLFQDVQTITHVQAAQKGIALVFEAPEGGHPALRCDLSKTKQVLVNLVGNSLKFTPKGSITVRAVFHEPLGHVIIEVVDTGIGIPKEQQRVIFEKFAQGDGSTTRKYGGTGLGLAISRSLVELQGGVIGVDSDGMGHGTRLYFSLPLWAETAASIPASDAVVPIEGPAHGPLVLIVEDDPIFRRFLTALLQGHGYRTVEAPHAEAGWVLVRRFHPELVVLDYALSCTEGAVLRTGWDLAERMTHDAATRRIPLIFVTGFDTEVRERVSSTAFARKPEHLVKPIDGRHLVTRIEHLIGDVDGRPVRVLMADDDPMLAAFVRAVLPEDRFHIEHASNGEECLHILRTQPRGFDLLMLDLMMPEVSGYDVLREMALTGAGADLPVLVLTNHADAHTAEEKRLLEEGVVLDILSKNAVHEDPRLLARLLDSHLHAAREPDQTREEAA